MKLLLITLCTLFSVNTFASGPAPRWQMQCTSAIETPGSSSDEVRATMYAIGTSVAISAQMFYDGVDLLCSYQGNCTGLNNQKDIIPADEAKLFRDKKGIVTGFSYGNYTFKCK